MGNTKENNGNGDKAMLIGMTIRNDYDNYTSLVIPKEFAKKLDIENSKVSMSLIDGFDGNRHLVVSKYYKEIVIHGSLIRIIIFGYTT